MAAPAAAAGGTTGNLTWDLTGGTLTISGEGKMPYYSNSDAVPWASYRSSITSVVIEDGVTSIGVRAFFYCSGLTSVVIPSSVTSIGDEAFSWCSGLTSVVIPSSVTSIGNSAFGYCSGLTSVEIPSSVTYINSYAFGSCSNLTSINVDGGNTKYKSLDGVLFSKDGTLLHTYPAGKSAVSYEIPSSVTSIGSSAFKYCSGLTSVVIPSSVTSIGSYAFAWCSGLTSVEIPSNVTSIGYAAFKGCSGLTSIEIPSSVTSIGWGAFDGCSGLTSVVIPSSVTSVSGGAFYDLAANSIIYCTNASLLSGDSKYSPDLTAIAVKNTDGSYTFTSDVEDLALSAANAPSGITYGGWFAESTFTTPVTSIAAGTNPTLWLKGGSGPAVTASGTTGNLTWVLYEDGKLVISGEGKMPDYSNSDAVPWASYRNLITSVVIEDGVTSIGRCAFEYCRGLTSVVIPSSVTSIGNGAFFECRGLTSVVIPFGVTSIGVQAFEFCRGLISIEIPSSVTSIGESAFDSCSYPSIDIPASVTSIGWYAFGRCSNLTSINVVEENTMYKDIDGVLFSKDGTLLHTYPAGKSAASYDIPSSVTSIGQGAFEGCSGLTSVVIPSNVTSIGSSAFYYCRGLTSVDIPSNVTSVSAGAFIYCSNLTSINVGGENVQYKSIDGVLFSKDGTLLHTYPAGKSATSYDIPSSVTSIGSSAFWYCSGLTSVVIPSSVTSIGYYAFYGCSGLTSVDIPSNVTSIDSWAFYNLAANSIIYCTNASLLSGEYTTSNTALAVKNLDGSCTFTSAVTNLALSAANAPSGITYGGWFKESSFTTPVTSIAAGTNPTLWLKNLAHTVTVTSTVGGSASASQTSAAEGTLITLSASADTGYVFDRWQVVSGGVTITGNKFTMPACDVEIKAVFKAAEEPTDGLHLLSGWNFVSVPKKPAAAYDTAAELFGSVSTGGKSILTYNAVTKSWEQVTASTVIEPLNAYWVYSVGSMTLTPAFDSEAHAPAMKTLYEGWNAVGLSAEESMPASIAFAGIDWRTYLSWDAAKQKYNAPIIKGVSGTYGDSNPVLLWEGGWIYMDANGTYIGFA